MKIKEIKKSKEEFCVACAIPFLAAGALGTGGATVGSTNGESHKKFKKILLWGGIGLTVLSLIIMIWYFTRCKTCKK